MNKYGYEVISCSKLDIQFIKKLNINNYKNKKLVIQVKNTKCIDKTALLYLKNNYNIDIKISIIGPYDDEKQENEQKKEKYFYNTLYDIDELYRIITNFEKIEDNIDPKWNEFDIIVYLAETIVRNIMYDPEYILMRNKGIEIPKKIGLQDLADYYDRSLRGMLTRKAVCAGYSVIFKELANRNGIECKYVSGAAYSESGICRGGHAWNLVRINGVIYPIDITWKNTKYRCGDFNNVNDISCDIEEFKKKHRPYDMQNNNGLTQIPKEIVKKSKKKTIIRKHYNATTYVIKRNDKTSFVLSQIGKYKGLYRYLYSEINDDGSYSTPTIVFSESNLVKEINEHNFEKSDHYNKFMQSFANVLFSKENLNDSKTNRKTKYIGCCELPNRRGYVNNSKEILKSEKAINTFNLDNIKSKKRSDGSIVTLVQFQNKINNGFLYEYYVYVLSQGPSVMEYNVYSNTNYFSLSSTMVVNSILSDENLKKSIVRSGILK
ncbi:MAG: transglutaminase domain-containing protein [Bacilli bacterium]|nr:transglutaminase domain-containing protein [Bacilli bacterium]